MNAMYQPQSDVWEYDPTINNWRQVLAAPPPACAFQGATAVGDQLVIFGGIVTGGGPSSETWVFDTVASSWIQGQDFPGVGYGESMASHNGKALVIGHTEGEIHVYDVALDTWTTVPATGGARSTTTATGAGAGPSARVLALTAQTPNTAWLLGGEDVNTAATLGDAWALDLTTLTWTPCESVDPIRHSAMAVIGSAGSLAPSRLRARTGPVQLLIFSGLNASGQVTDKQIVYDPDSKPSVILYINKNDLTCGGNSPCYTSIQSAIDAADTGSAIRIVQGTYNESFALSESRSLTLQGGLDSTFTTVSGRSTVNKMTIGKGEVKLNKGCLGIVGTGN